MKFNIKLEGKPHKSKKEYLGYPKQLLSVKRIMNILDFKKSQAQNLLQLLQVNETIFFEESFVYIHKNFGILSNEGFYKNLKITI